MTFAPPEVSRAATRRIGAASAILWILGTIVLIVVGATAAYAFVVNPYVGGGLLGDDGYYGGGYPWEADQPLVATETDGVWSADGSGVIRIPASQFADARMATIVSGGEVILYRTNPSLGLPTDDYFFPEYLFHVDVDRPRVIVPDGGDIELWVEAGQAWQLRMEPLDATLMDDSGASGEGDAYLVYTGTAVSARFIHSGEGNFFVSISTAYDSDIPIIDSGEINQRLSWQPDSYVVFFIESDLGGGAWTVDIDELARPTPTPTETP